MKKDEIRVSAKIAKQLTLTEVRDQGDRVYIKGVDKYGIMWEHYQIVPEFCSNEAAAKQAKTFLTKLGNCQEGDKVFCYCVIRQMGDSEMGDNYAGVYRNIDQIVCKC